MTARDVLKVYQRLEMRRVNAWLDGGWGIDALLCEQTRPHKDLDLVAKAEDIALLKAILGGEGFTHIERTGPALVLRDNAGRAIDVHAVRLDAEGNGIYRMENGQDWIYPAAGFQGRGIIDGVQVRCLSAEIQVLCHAHGYTLTEKDLLDMKHLSERFDVQLPPKMRLSPPASSP